MSDYYQTILQQICDELLPSLPQGKVAGYIPQLANVDETEFGMAVLRLHDGRPWRIF